jgi:ceramide glucosyltransferase
MVRRQVALVNCFYRLANPTTLAMQWEAVAINADFWSQVLQSCSLKPMDFALGAAMLTRRAELAGIGGFAAIKDCLADDYQLGNRIARNRSGTGVPPVCGSQGEKRAAFTSHAQQDRRDACPTKRIEICPVVVECWDAPAGWAAVWKHQLRWARTIRVCQPGPYFFSILSNPTLWPLLWVALEPGRPSLFFLGIALATRLVVTLDLQRRLASGGSIVNRKSKIVNQMEPPHVGCYGGGFWLAPVKDVLQTAIWALAFTGNTVEWRGRRMKLRRDGTLIPA